MVIQRDSPYTIDDDDVDEDEDQEDTGLDLQHNQDLLDRHEYLINNPHDPIEQDMPLHQPIPPIPPIAAPPPENPPPTQGNLVPDQPLEEDDDKDFLFKCELIELVQTHPLLYDMAHPDYQKANKRIDAWDDIAVALDIDSHDKEKSKHFQLVKNYLLFPLSI